MKKSKTIIIVLAILGLVYNIVLLATEVNNYLCICSNFYKWSILISLILLIVLPIFFIFKKPPENNDYVVFLGTVAILSAFLINGYLVYTGVKHFSNFPKFINIAITALLMTPFPILSYFIFNSKQKEDNTNDKK